MVAKNNVFLTTLNFSKFLKEDKPNIFAGNSDVFTLAILGHFVDLLYAIYSQAKSSKLRWFTFEKK